MKKGLDLRMVFVAGWAALALLLAAVAGPAAAADDQGEEPAAEAVAQKKYRWFALPTVFFDADDGFGFGARFEIQRLDPEIDPYRWGLVVHASMSIRGWHGHRIKVDFPALGPRGNLRFSAYVSYRQWLNDGYWGIGNGTARQREFVGDFDKEDPARKRYRYYLIQPYGNFTFRAGVGGPLAVYANVVLQYSKVKTYDDCLLEDHQPEGMQGGFSAQLLAGLMVDTREPEIEPQKGVLLEMAARISPSFPNSTGPYYGPFVSLRAYTSPPSGRVVLAWRVMAEWLFGDIPFYEMVRWGSFTPIDGFGGWQTLRGVSFGRWRAPAKALSNLELRITLGSHKFFKSTLGWQLVPFTDVGAVWGAQELATAPPPDVPFHPTAGLGLRLILADAFMVRVDAGFGPDAIREPDGSITQAPDWGIYVVFDQMY